MTTTDLSASTTADTPQKANCCMACNRWIDPAAHTGGDPFEHCPSCGTDNRGMVSARTGRSPQALPDMDVGAARGHPGAGKLNSPHAERFLEAQPST